MSHSPPAFPVSVPTSASVSPLTIPVFAPTPGPFLFLDPLLAHIGVNVFSALKNTAIYNLLMRISNNSRQPSFLTVP